MMIEFFILYNSRFKKDFFFKCDLVQTYLLKNSVNFKKKHYQEKMLRAFYKIRTFKYISYKLDLVTIQHQVIDNSPD